ncbi:hypothetical protein EDC02_5057 [Micromonospora sp. Llam0]|uniref:hypothetical protein n=1 Tax=Micromonospora sp. Llam0 TaxID=2485143 RepID=UPI000F4A1880|nr:hypothetical protein [Micromonospora sp. Llam0]ROO63046.1 hypothetical protein EDC02_5057 [Micromonospora sp. Llam0]
MTRIDIALFNFQDGGWTPDGGPDFAPLQQAFADVTAAPALILLCEAKRYSDNAGAAKYAAAEALSDQLGVPYVAELGWMPRGPMPPAIFYNPNLLALRRWWNQDDPAAFDDQRNVARFALRDSGAVRDHRREFLAFVHHFAPLSGDARLEEARRVSRYGSTEPLPVIGGGDLNGTASGSHFPERDWMAATPNQRTHKGMLRPDGTWGPDTRALDHLIGEWDDITGQRTNGCGLHALAEMAWRTDPNQPILPTVNPDIDPGGGLLIDWLLANDAMTPHVLPDTYRVHLPDPGQRPPSDHRLVTAAIDL